jgi:hypothetical protein
VLSGEETSDYANDAANFAQFNAATIVALEPAIAPLLNHAAPVAFERDDSGKFVEVSTG